MYALLERGFEVSATGSPRAALDTLAVVQPDVVVLDAGVREMSASEFISRQRSRRDVSAIPVLVALSSPFDDVGRWESVSVLARPFTPDELATAVRALAGDERNAASDWRDDTATLGDNRGR